MTDWDRGFPSASYDAWKTREPDWDDDPCAEVRREMGQEIDERDDTINGLRNAMIDALGYIMATPDNDQRARLIVYLRETLGLPDPSKPEQSDDIAF